MRRVLDVATSRLLVKRIVRIMLMYSFTLLNISMSFIFGNVFFIYLIVAGIALYALEMLNVSIRIQKRAENKHNDSNKLIIRTRDGEINE